MFFSSLNRKLKKKSVLSGDLKKDVGTKKFRIPQRVQAH